jgi:hypothetical protein
MAKTRDQSQPMTMVMPTRQEVAYVQMEIGRKPSQTLTYIHSDYSSPFKTIRHAEKYVSASIVNIKKLLAIKHDQPESICPCTASHRKGELPLTASQCCQGHLNPQPTL